MWSSEKSLVAQLHHDHIVHPRLFIRRWWLALSWSSQKPLRGQVSDSRLQVYEINDTQQDQLAQFLGHNIRVHREFYRLPLDITQKAMLAKLLTAVNDGQSLSDANLEDLHIDANSKPFIDVLLWKKKIICEIWCSLKQLFFYRSLQFYIYMIYAKLHRLL